MAFGPPKGNKNAVRATIWRQAIARAARPSDLKEIAEVVVAAAKSGEPWAITEIGNRLDGKPVQQIDHTGDFGQRLANELSNRELEMIAAGHDPSAPEATEATGSTIN